MANKIDVLAVLDFLASHDWDGDELPGNEAVAEARAAVAELIEADKAFDIAMDDYHSTAPAHRGKRWPAVTVARERRAAALARVTGR